MRELDQVGTALAGALGFSTNQNEARLKVICNGVDKNSRETFIIVECRIRARTTPEMDTGETKQRGNTRTKKKSRGLKSPGKPKTPHKSLMQRINQMAANREHTSALVGGNGGE